MDSKINQLRGTVRAVFSPRLSLHNTTIFYYLYQKTTAIIFQIAPYLWEMVTSYVSFQQVKVPSS